MKNVHILGIYLKDPTFFFFAGGGVGFTKNQYRGGGLPKNWVGQFAYLREGVWQERGGVVFLRGVGTPMHTMPLPTGEIPLLKNLWALSRSQFWSLCST